MTNNKLFIFSALLVASLASNAQTLDRSIRPKPGPAPTLQMGSSQSFISSNGIKVFVVENHKLPVVSYSIDFDIRPSLQGDMAGFQDMLGDLLTAGTKTKTKDQFNEELDRLGGSLDIGNDGLFMQSLKKNSDKLLSLASEVLTQPKFSQEELTKIKKQAKASLAQALDDPEAMSENITKILNYGKNHPYGEITTEASVDKITLQRCQQFFETYFRPNVAYMAIVGDITFEEAKQQVEKHFAKWQKKEVPRANYPTPKAPTGATVAVINKSSAVQSVIDVTYPINMKQGHPDEVKLKVANGILGGGSTGRLFQNLRETHAWTYGSYSSFRSDELPNAGKFSATANAATNASDSSVAEILKEMNRLRTELVPAEQLQGYKNYMSGTFALGLEDPKTLARYAINEKKYNMPKDYYKNYLKSVDAVTALDVMEVAKKYITPGVATITVAGDKKQVAEKLKKFGPVTIYDIYGNVQKDETISASLAKMSATDVIKKHIEVTGGEKAWLKVGDMKSIYTAEMMGSVMEIITQRKAPNKMALDVKMGEQTMQKIVFNGNKGYMTMMGQKNDFDAEQIEKFKDEAILNAELLYLGGDYKVTLLGTENVNGATAYQIEIMKPSGSKAIEYFDVKTGFKVKTEEEEDGPQGKTMNSRYYADYKKGAGDLWYPNVIKQNMGLQVIDLKLKTVEVNTGIKEDVFE